MTNINDDYYHTLDRGYSPMDDVYAGNLNSKPDYNHQSGELVGDSFAGLSPKIIGISAPPMKDQLESLKSRIFQGASKVELGFWGRGKGQMGQGGTTPGMYDKEMRQAIKELAEVNEMNLSTHVAPSIANWSGLSQNKFSDQEREGNIREAQRTVDFAADVTKGGAIVVHTGEFPRSIWDKWKHQNFTGYEDEKKEAIHYLVDSKTGDIISGVKNNEKIWEPIKKVVDGEVQYLRDQNGDIMKDEDGHEMEIYETDDFGNVKVTGIEFSKWAEEKKKKHGWSDDETVKKFFEDQQMTQILHATGQAKYFGDGFYRGQEQLEDLRKEVKKLKYLKDKMSEEEFFIHARETAQKFGKRLTHKEDVFDVFKDMRRQLFNTFQYGRETLLGGAKQREEIKDRIKRAVSIEEYGMKKTADSIARLGMYAWDKTMAKKKHEADFKDLFISPENIFPEQYGAHPEELKNIVLKSREHMVKKLVEDRKMNKQRAEKIAKKHIKATFDVGHAYTWRKYYKGTDKEFNKWLDKQVDDLNKHKIIGHVHISDNFGYEDEHVTPGLGKVPIKRFVEKMKKAGVTDMVVEPAHQDYKAMLGGWRTFGSSIYSVSKPGITRDRWTDIENSYFGHVGPPNYIIGDYSPSQDFRGAPFYTGVPFE